MKTINERNRVWAAVKMLDENSDRKKGRRIVKGYRDSDTGTLAAILLGVGEKIAHQDRLVIEYADGYVLVFMHGPNKMEDIGPYNTIQQADAGAAFLYNGELLTELPASDPLLHMIEEQNHGHPY